MIYSVNKKNILYFPYQRIKKIKHMILDNTLKTKIKVILSSNPADKTNVSERTKEAKQLLKQLEKDLKMESLSFEHPVFKEGIKDNEKFDIFDIANMTVYEIKLSGKNIGHEFYKDVFKVLAYNKNETKKIKKFVFVSEEAPLNLFKGKHLISDIKSLTKEFGLEIDFLDF
jgi:hypothetical protein